MPAVSGRAAGYIATLYYTTTVISDKTEANLDALTSDDTNMIIDVSSMGALSKNREIIPIPVYGQDTAGALPGQAESNTFDFTVTLSLDNSNHVAIRDDTAKSERTFVVYFNQETNNQETWAAFDGFIANASVNQAIDGAITMDVSVARSGDITWVNHT